MCAYVYLVFLSSRTNWYYNDVGLSMVLIQHNEAQQPRVKKLRKSMMEALDTKGNR